MGDIHCKPQRAAGSLLASIFVLMGGFLSCAAVIFAFSREPRGPLFILGGSFAGVSLLLWLLRDRPAAGQRQRFAWVFSRGARPKSLDYQPKLIRSTPHSYGTNHPPTVEEVRDLKGTPRNWVPSNLPSGRRSPRGERET